MRENGFVADIDSLGATTYTCIIWTVNCQIALITSHFTWIQHLSIWGSILLWYIFLLVYGALPPNFSGNAFQVLVEGIGPAPLYWMITVLVVVVSLLPYFIHIVIQRSYFPMDDHIIQEMEQCYKKYDVRDNEMWVREQRNSQRSTRIGFSARDFLISLKKLAVKRAIAIGHVQLANKFDLKLEPVMSIEELKNHIAFKARKEFYE
ncbi:hypothetical protein Goari_002185, partial [Gossypium aridum]|nr:hypothetical protein [Gossypium aridum]